MLVDNKWLLIHDKCSITGTKYDHSFSNPKTISISINDILTMQTTEVTGIKAIEEYNKFNLNPKIPNDLDDKMYNVSVYKTHTNDLIFTIVSIDHNKLYDIVKNNKVIPNIDFLKTLSRNHLFYIKLQTTGILYTSDERSLININSNNIITSVLNTTGTPNDIMIENPDFIENSVKLYDYQKRSIFWMLEKEKNFSEISFNLNDEIQIGNVYFDAIKQQFTLGDARNKIAFKGGLLIDEVGLGKTIQMITMSLLNQKNNLQYITPNVNKLNSRATLILCPNQLCGQWKREIENKIKKEHDITIIPLLTKTHFDKYTYQDLLDADFVLVSFSFLDNKSFLSSWLDEATHKKNYTKSINFNLDEMKIFIDAMCDEIVKDPQILNITNPLLFAIKFHRIIVDEIHEVFTLDKYTYMKNILPLFNANYKWGMSGTPFDKGNQCLVNIVDYITDYSNEYKNRILTIDSIVNHLSTNVFRRNTKKSVQSEYELQPVKETVVWLKFTHTERMMYNAYLANPNNSKYSVFLRQLCCHPKLAEEIKDILSNCKTLEDMEKTMVGHYRKNMEISLNKVTDIKSRILLKEQRIKIYERYRQKRLLSTLKYLCKIDTDSLLPKNKKDENNEPIDETYIKKCMADINKDDLLNDDNLQDDDYIEGGKKCILISDDNQTEILKILKDVWNKNRTTYDNMIDDLNNFKNKLLEVQKEYDGNKTTFDFFNNVLERIKKTTNKNKNEDNEDDNDNDDDNNCGICLSEIPEDDIGVTKCGHIYCFECIKTIIADKHKCPYCNRGLKDNELYMISYEKKNKQNKNNQEINDKLHLINSVGTKLANLIYYLKQTKEHVIIFSQWDDLLRKVADILNDYGISNISCRGNVWQRDKAIRLFNNNNDIRVIMLSSESAASGTNLTKASKVILLDPVCGSYEYRKNTEGQAIGRAHRMGQTKQVEVVRFIIKNSIEEEIYNDNKLEDSKHMTKIVFETNDDSITLSDDKVKEIENSFNTNKNDLKKKTAVAIPKNKNHNIDDDIDIDDDSD